MTAPEESVQSVGLKALDLPKSSPSPETDGGSMTDFEQIKQQNEERQKRVAEERRQHNERLKRELGLRK